jgi:hypothetical protein
MGYREADSWTYLRLKEKMLKSDREAIFSDGRVLPAFIYNTVKTSSSRHRPCRASFDLVRSPSQPRFLRLLFRKRTSLWSKTNP